MEKDNPLLFKYTLIGASGVGKSHAALCWSWVFDPVLTIIGSTSTSASLCREISGCRFQDQKHGEWELEDKAQIWDTSGLERFRTITSSYYKGSQAGFIVFAVDDRESFDHLDDWIKEIRGMRLKESSKLCWEIRWRQPIAKFRKRRGRRGPGSMELFISRLPRRMI